ncbi:Uncharacterised protein [Mycobacteroides abscessus subsp. abscessus]|nr:Uncharacterised protein [Mycobacteroides abscessus subsp. abscessus]
MSAYPAPLSRVAIFCAASVQLPCDAVVLVSTNSRYRSRNAPRSSLTAGAVVAGEPWFCVVPQDARASTATARVRIRCMVSFIHL